MKKTILLFIVVCSLFLLYECSYAQTPVVTITPSSDTICSGDYATFTASGGGTYQWNTGCPSASITVAPSFTVTYVVTVTKNGNTASDEVTLYVNPIPLTNAGSDQKICRTDTAFLIATGGNTYQWSTGDTTAAVHYTPSVTTTYTVTASYTNGCTSSDDVVVMVYAAHTSNKTIICGGSVQIDSVTTNYVGAGTFSYLWSPSTGLNSNTIPNPIATVTSTTTYHLSVTLPNGCLATDSITVHVNPLTINVGLNKTIICGGSTQLDSIKTNYAGTGTLSYIWSPSSGLNSNTIPNPIATATCNTTYFVTVTSSDGCMAVNNVRVFVNPLAAQAHSDKTIICGGSAQLDSVTTNYSGTGTLSYLWSPSSGLNSDTILNPIATVTSNTTYYVTVTTHNGCYATSVVNVFVDPLTINAINTSTSCGNAAAIITTTNYTGSGALTYSWYPTASLSASNIASPLAEPAASTVYTVTTTTPNGCIATHHAIVTLVPLPAEQICYVEFDTVTSKNSINWSTGFTSNIDSIHIYNEVLTNVWSLIGSAPATANHFIDTHSNPFNQSYSYKISVKDTCGFETDTSTTHTTVTLLVSYAPSTYTYGFTWSAYKGLSVPSYYLYGNTSSNKDSLIGSVPGNQYFYNYTNPNSGFLRYFIAFNTPTCGSKTTHLVKSNWVQGTTGINEISNDNLINIYPNPVTDNLQIQTNLKIKNIGIKDIAGRLLSTAISKTIDCSSFAKGVYFVRIETEKGVEVKKFIKE